MRDASRAGRSPTRSCSASGRRRGMPSRWGSGRRVTGARALAAYARERLAEMRRRAGARPRPVSCVPSSPRSVGRTERGAGEARPAGARYQHQLAGARGRRHRHGREAGGAPRSGSLPTTTTPPRRSTAPVAALAEVLEAIAPTRRASSTGSSTFHTVSATRSWPFAVGMDHVRLVERADPGHVPRAGTAPAAGRSSRPGRGRRP